ncbi:MAG TPA: hypothetical protein PKW80_10395 [Bacteroidales bacterium]|nr:hypothetical protein [Bacteroidales bacterium]
MYIKIPFQIKKGLIETEEDIKQSINEFIELIVSSFGKSFKPESDFGFGFKNFKFEIFDEINGTIMNKKRPDKLLAKTNGKREKEIYKNGNDDYSKKINETSKNSNSFAYDLKKIIEKYECRLKDVYVDMKYTQKEKMITLLIKGKINNERGNDYTHEISFQVW